MLYKTKTDYVEFKRTVDRLLAERFSLGFYEGRILAELGDQAASAIARVLHMPVPRAETSGERECYSQS